MAETNFIPVRGNDINNTSVENGQFLINPATKRAYIDAPVEDGGTVGRTMLYGDAFVNIDNNGTITTADGNTKSVSLGKTYTGEPPISIDTNNNKISVGKATSSSLGVIKIGRGLTADNNGVATINIGTGLALSDAAADDGGKLYCTVTDTWHLNKADSEGYVLKSGANYNAVWMAGPDSSDPNPQWRPLPKAANNTFGVVKVGNNINATNGTISVPTATNNTLGVVKAGNGLSIDNGSVSMSVERPFTFTNNKLDIKIDLPEKLYPLTEDLTEGQEKKGEKYYSLVTDGKGKLRYISDFYSQVLYSANYEKRKVTNSSTDDTIPYYVTEHNQVAVDRYNSALRITKYLNFAFNEGGVNNVEFNRNANGVWYMNPAGNTNYYWTKFIYNWRGKEGKADWGTTFDGAPFVVSSVISANGYPLQCVVTATYKEYNETKTCFEFTLFSENQIPNPGAFEANFILYGIKTIKDEEDIFHT